MFTGIVEEIGTLKAVQKGRYSAVLRIQAKKILEDVHIGDSIAVNGICLTVTEFTQSEFAADRKGNKAKSNIGYDREFFRINIKMLLHFSRKLKVKFFA